MEESYFNTEQQILIFNQMKWFPIILLIGQGFGALRRFLELFDIESFGLAIAHGICQGLFGAF
eukprot:UN11657